MTTPLLARLTMMYDHRGDGIPTQPVNPDGEEAAELIAVLMAALEPFVLHLRDDVPDDYVVDLVAHTAGEYRAARAALAKGGRDSG